MDSHKSSYGSPSEASVVKEDLQDLIDDVVTSHTRNHDKETATEQHSPGNHPLGAAATTPTRTEHEAALSQGVEDVLQGLIDEAIASARENKGEEPVPGGGGGGPQSALAALLARMTSQQRGGGNRAGSSPIVIVISSDEESISDDEPFPRFLMRRSRSGGKRSQGSATLPGTPTAATDATGGSSGRPSSSSSSAGFSGASTIRRDDPGADAGRQESIVAKIQRRPPVEFPRHAYGRRQKRRYETSSDDDEGAGRRGRGSRRRSGRAGEQAETFIDLTLHSEPEESPHAEASPPPAAPDRLPKKKKKQKQKQKREGNDKQKRRPEPPSGKRNSIGQMAAAAATASSGKRWKY
ncbi:hypothetical protein DL764_007378 [Monosporascus ibericus]|uniref:Uncharacterized protein n=1 Tax=Monosporascus ibericus TaxID=155417 RepID=A0A4Q4T1A3_9PEZI|nr:hypothetical protein DL764_007378 [Monosporascus ibericus]